ncbi:MAG: hypothetical protein IH968_19185 [Gemmatimonadetes bacterium]|nr:hypothetical protein [Gemmatimonadota bacterium]
MTVRLSDFARTLSTETAFTVLAAAKQLQAAGKDVVELEIGDGWRLGFAVSSPALRLRAPYPVEGEDRP